MQLKGWPLIRLQNEQGESLLEEYFQHTTEPVRRMLSKMYVTEDWVCASTRTVDLVRHKNVQIGPNPTLRKQETGNVHIRKKRDSMAKIRYNTTTQNESKIAP